MEYFSANFDPLISMGSSMARAKHLAGADRKEAAKDFAVLFYAQVLKQVFDSQSGVFGADETKNNYFGNLGMYKEIYYEKFARELIDKGGLDALLSKDILPGEKGII